MICAESVLGMFAVISAVLNGSVSNRAELSGILDLPLNKMHYLKMLLQWNLGLV